MAERRTKAQGAAKADDASLSKVQLQHQIEETRDSISQTVEEIKETVTDKYEAVKDTVADVIGWNEEFSKNPVVWGIGAVSVGLIIGYSIALVRQDEGRSSSRSGQKDSAVDNFFDGLSRVGMTMILPAVTHKIRDLFGVDLTQQLLGLTSGHQEQKETRTRRKSGTGKRRASKKGAGKGRATKKRGSK